MAKTVGLCLLLVVLVGCALLQPHWQTIPPPGGCDQCHRLPIAANWQAVASSVEVPRAGERYPWQRPEGNRTPDQPLPGQQLQEQDCFRCHRSPDLAHADYHGRYHRLP